MNRPLKIGILEGDNIGLEVVPKAIKAMRAAGQKAGRTKRGRLNYLDFGKIFRL